MSNCQDNYCATFRNYPWIELDRAALRHNVEALRKRLHEHKLTQTAVSLAYAQELNRRGKSIDVHIKIDTGMHRLGLHWESLDELAGIFHCENLHVTGAFTHLCADGLAAEQGRRFYQAVNGLKERGYALPKIHLLASDGLLRHPELGGDYARVGLALCGVGEKELRPVLTLKARVSQARGMTGSLRPSGPAGLPCSLSAMLTACPALCPAARAACCSTAKERLLPG